MPEGSISAALEGATVPTEGSVAGDLATGLGAGLQGLLAEQRRQEEERLRKAALALEKQRVDLSEENVDLQRERLRSEEERFDIRTEMDRDRLKFQQETFDTELDRERRIRQETGEGARRLLKDFGMAPELVDTLSPEAAQDQLDYLQQHRLEELTGRTRLLSDSMRGLIQIRQDLGEAEDRAFSQYQDNLANFTDWQERFLSSTEEGQIIQGMSDPEARDQALREAYAEGNQAQYQQLQQSLAELQAIQEAKQDRSGQLREILDVTLQGEMSFPTLGPSEAPGRRGSGYSGQTPGQQARNQGRIRMLYQQDPELLVDQYDSLTAMEYPVDDVLSDMGTTIQELSQSVEEARAGLGEIRMVPTDSGEPIPSIEGFMQAQEELPPLLRLLNTGSFSEVKAAAQRLINRDLMTREQVLETIPNERMRVLIEQSLPVRLNIPR